MNKETYFFDTYAFFEVIGGNPAYRKYLDANAVTTIFNIAELNYNLKKRKGETIADKYTEKYGDFMIDVTLEDVKNAMNLKVRKKELSIPDAIGYTIARKYGIKFLTGDGDFKRMPHVEFVK